MATAVEAAAAALGEDAVLSVLSARRMSAGRVNEAPSRCEVEPMRPGRVFVTNRLGPLFTVYMLLMVCSRGGLRIRVVLVFTAVTAQIYFLCVRGGWCEFCGRKIKSVTRARIDSRTRTAFE